MLGLTSIKGPHFPSSSLLLQEGKSSLDFSGTEPVQNTQAFSSSSSIHFSPSVAQSPSLLLPPEQVRCI